MIDKKLRCILHGSPSQNLKVVSSIQGRFGGKIFGTYDLQKAIRYLGGFESGGDSWMRTEKGKMFVFNTNPDKLKYQK